MVREAKRKPYWLRSDQPPFAQSAVCLGREIQVQTGWNWPLPVRVVLHRKIAEHFALPASSLTTSYAPL